MVHTPVLPRRKKPADLRGGSSPVWAFSVRLTPPKPHRYAGQACPRCPERACGADPGGTSACAEGAGPARREAAAPQGQTSPTPLSFFKVLRTSPPRLRLRVPSEVCTLRRGRYPLCAGLRPTEGKPMCRSGACKEGPAPPQGRLNGHRPFRPRTAAVGVERGTAHASRWIRRALVERRDRNESRERFDNDGLTPVVGRTAYHPSVLACRRVQQQRCGEHPCWRA